MCQSETMLLAPQPTAIIAPMRFPVTSAHRFSPAVLALALAVGPPRSAAQHVIRPASANEPPSMAAYREAAARIIGTALEDDTAYRRLAYLSDRIGHRLSGSPQLEAAIAWAVDEMKRERQEST
jgi:carboxypeptidase Q